jgi:hypothetical protein
MALIGRRMDHHDIADPSLQPTITLAFPSAENVVSVTCVLFNGSRSRVLSGPHEVVRVEC